MRETVRHFCRPTPLWGAKRQGQALPMAGSARLRKIGLVALARQLLIVLWRFLATGVLPQAASLKAQVRIR